MGDACSDCKSWEEEMYWTHFQSLRFSLFLHGDFTTRIAIPKKVTDNLRGKFPETLVLKGPGTATWDVGLTGEGNKLFFEDGWEEFVKDNSLGENDFLIFKYDKHSSMDVLMFDGKSLCEKEASYFIRKCGHAKTEAQYILNRRTGDDVVEAVPTVSPTTPQCTSPVQPRNANTVPEQSGKGVAARVKRLKTARRTFPQSCNSKKIIENRSPSNSVEEDESNHVDLVNEVMPFKGSGRSTQVYESTRRDVTVEEKKNALRLAQTALTAQSFLVIMRPTHVYKRFFMSIPADWVTGHLSPKSQDVILHYQGKTWRAKYQHTARGTGGLTGGWKNFALENDLEEFDVCVFKPMSEPSSTLSLEIALFRVVNDVAPLAEARFY